MSPSAKATKIAALTQYVDTHPEDNARRWELARYLFNSWDYRSALEHLKILHRRAPDNVAINTSPFREKREMFKQSGFLLTAQVAEYDAWGADQISDRQKKLAKLAVDTWPLA